MSGAGNLPVSIPAGVTVTVSNDNVVTAKSPKGERKEQIHKDMAIKVEDGTVKVAKRFTVQGNELVKSIKEEEGTVTIAGPSDSEEHKALQKASRSLISNLVEGLKRYTPTFIISSECISCGTCEDDCPADCISMGEEHFEIDQEACVKCGTCFEICPVSAIIEE